ncbi:hypothetical protein NK356_15355 [Chryseobacterium sp. S0630]|uniref:hypothetical protein n=1 Tax=Chryseobacterium sp. S0630 TaxID=2957803 RepID=UPI000A760CC8|nr:hypothetical protein [Chryseobacterium sp. S0630]MCP1300550.1 hypothetical protein [Chryseobacterium sp. S0630]
MYYNKVNEIDSIYRMAKQPEKAIKLYKALFRKYHPLNQERIEELIAKDFFKKNKN